MSWPVTGELHTGIQTHCTAGHHQVDKVPFLPPSVPELYFWFTNQGPTCFTECNSSSSQVDGNLPRSIGRYEGLCLPLRNQETLYHSLYLECTHQPTALLCPCLSQYLIPMLILDLWMLPYLSKATLYMLWSGWLLRQEDYPDKPNMNTQFLKSEHSYLVWGGVEHEDPKGENNAACSCWFWK